MARSTVFRYKGKEIDPQTAGRELNVRAVIAGRLLKRGDLVSLGVELVDVEDGAQLWSGYYNRSLTDIFAMQDQIATEISDKLRVRLTGVQRKRLTKRHTQITEAYQLYLKGRFHFARRTEESFKRSFEYFQQAVERDPGYALAYAGLADAYLVAQHYSVIAPAVGLPKARAAVARALELDESLAEAHTTLAVIRSLHDWDAEAAEKEFQRAIELNPNYSTAFLWYGVMHLGPLGRFGEAEAALKRALEIDPFSLIINTHLGTVFTCARQYEAAAKQFLNTLAMEPNFPEAHLFLGVLYWCSGKIEQAIGHVQQGITLSKGDVRMRCYLASMEAASGHKEEAQAQLQELLSLAESRYISPCFLSVAYLGLGDFDKVFEMLEKAFQERDPQLRFANIVPVFDVLRSDPRFQDLLRRIHLVP